MTGASNKASSDQARVTKDPVPEKKEASLCAVDGRLPDELVEALGVQLTPRLKSFP